MRWRGPIRAGEARFAGRYDVAVEPGEIALAFTLDALPGPLEGAELTVRARADRRVEREIELRVACATITGRTRFEDGTPFPFVYVETECQGGLHSNGGQADERGEFVLEVPDVGRPFTLRASAHGLSITKEGLAAGARGVELVFARRYPLLVCFCDGDSGAELHLFDHVRLLARSGADGFQDVEFEETTPDLDGWIETRLAAPRVDLLACPGNRRMAAFGRRIARDVVLDSSDGRAARVELVLQRVAPLVLELDARGEPLPEECELVLVEEELAEGLTRIAEGFEDEHGLLHARSVTFGDDGRAVLQGCAPIGMPPSASPASASASAASRNASIDHPARRRVRASARVTMPQAPPRRRYGDRRIAGSSRARHGDAWRPREVSAEKSALSGAKP